MKELDVEVLFSLKYVFVPQRRKKNSMFAFKVRAAVKDQAIILAGVWTSTEKKPHNRMWLHCFFVLWSAVVPEA